MKPALNSGLFYFNCCRVHVRYITEMAFGLEGLYRVHWIFLGYYVLHVPLD